MMKVRLVILIMVTTVFQAFSQAKPIYFNGNRITSNADQATSYGVYGKLSEQDLWVLKRFDLYDNLMLSGSYKNEDLTKPHGKFTFYSSIFDYNQDNFTNFKNPKTDRYISQQGEFVDGVEQGKWYDYFPDGKIMGFRNYVDGKLHGEISFYTHKGRRILHGHYRHGLRDGIWLDLKKKVKEVFENDKLISTSKLTRAEILAVE